MSNISVDKISKKYFYKVNKGIIRREKKSVQAIDQISFDIKPGEILGLVGENGAGKTTIVKIISGVLKPDSGKVLIDNEDPFERSLEYRNKVALLLGQKGKLHPDMSINEAAEVYGAMYKLSTSVIRDRVMKMSAVLGLNSEDINKQARTLSLGQRMKGELCVSFINEPKVIFLDEPTIGLDIASIKSIRNFLKDYCCKQGAAVILTSHNLGDIVETSTKLLIVEKGKTVFYGNIEDLPKEYENNTRIKYQMSEKMEKLDIPNTIIDENYYITTCNSNEVDGVLNTIYSKGTVRNLDIEEKPIEKIIEEIMYGEQ